MALPKQAVTINFAKGVDTKTDPKQLEFGRFQSMNNSVFDEAGLLKKRDGYGSLPALPDATSSFLTTFGGNLTAIGNKLEAYSQNSMRWVDKGTFQPISTSVTPVVRSALSQIQADSVIAANGLVCTVYTEINNTTASYKYVIQDPVTGQNIIAPTAIPVSSGAITGSPRVFLLRNYFIIMFTNTITGTPHLQYVAVSSLDPSVVRPNADIAAVYTPATTVSWDAVVSGNNLYIAYNTVAGGQQIAITYLSAAFVVTAPVSFAGQIATMMSMTVDDSDSAAVVIYAAYYDLISTTGYTLAINTILNTVMSPTQIIAAGTVKNITCTAQNGSVEIAYEVANNYAYDSAAASNYLNKVNVIKPATVTTGTVGSTTAFIRSVGLASKGFLVNGVMYVLTAYDGKTSSVAAFQPTYFLVNISGNVVVKLAYQNGGGYLTLGLPQAQVSGTSVSIAYLFKDLIQSVNKSQGLLNAVGVYSQTGVNLSSMTFSAQTLSTAELGNNLNLSGGFLYAYDGNTLNEQNFHLYPDLDPDLDVNGTSKSLTVSHAGGSMTTQDYFYVAIYQWTDAQGNIFNSAPSVPAPAKAASFTASSNSVTVNVPACRLTYKPNVKIVIFRWSTAQQSYFQVTSIIAPTLNSTTADVIQFVDTQTDAQILGNSLLYTTGGVVENTGAPACTAITNFDTRNWLINAEDPNELWYSKQVSKGTPVEMSDLFTKYISPTAGAQGDTGPMKCLAPMDDKLILSKRNAFYYISGTGPDITGANNQYSEPIFITSTVGSENQNSFVMIPRGLMFQSDKGIWLLGRDLSTIYIGAPVEIYNQYTVTSANSIPGTNTVKFTMSNGVTLVYDYFYDQWDTDIGVPAVSSTLYQNLHTYINSSGRAAQVTPGAYLDSANPVLMSFLTGWINLAGIQGYQRAYYFYLIGEYITPHKLRLDIYYDYNEAPEQQQLITPTNGSPAYGQSSPYGQESPYGGGGSLEQWRIFFTKQKCQSFRIGLSEIYDPSLGIPAGAGLTISGITCVVAAKKGYVPVRSANSVGGSQ